MLADRLDSTSSRASRPRAAALALAAHGRAGSLGLAVPHDQGGQGGRWVDLFHHVADLAQHSLAAATVFALQRQFIEVLLAARNVALREYRLPALLEGSIGGACGATWRPWAEAVPLAGRDTGRGWRLDGRVGALPNVGTDWFLVGAPLRFGAAPGVAVVLLSSEQDGLRRCAEDAEGFEDVDRASLHLSGVHFREDEILDDEGAALARAVAPVTRVLRCALATGLARSVLAGIEGDAVRVRHGVALRVAVRALEAWMATRRAAGSAADEALPALLQRLEGVARDAARLQAGDGEPARRWRMQAEGLPAL